MDPLIEHSNISPYLENKLMSCQRNSWADQFTMFKFAPTSIVPCDKAPRSHQRKAPQAYIGAGNHGIEGYKQLIV